MNSLAVRFLILLFIGFWRSPVALAEFSLGDETFVLRGFGTLGGPYNFNDQAGFIRDKTQPEGARGEGVDWAIDSRLGLQLDWKPREDFSGSLQLVSKYRYDGSFTPLVTWAFLKYGFNPELEVRAGRLGFDAQFQTDSLNIGYAYLWVRPPVDYFGQWIFSHTDGIDLTMTRGLGEGALRSKLYVGQAHHQAIPVAGSSDGYSLDGSLIAGGYLEYQHPYWLFRIGYGAVQLENETVAEPLLNTLRNTGVSQAVTLAQEMSLVGKRLDFFNVGIAYDEGPLQSQLALRYLASDSLTFPSNVAGYWSVGYRIGQWTPYLIYSRVKSQQDHYTTGLPNNPPFSAINAGVAQALSVNQTDQQTFSLGARYDFARNADLKLQLDWVHSHVNPSFLWTDPESDWNGRATVFSVTLDFVF